MALRNRELLLEFHMSPKGGHNDRPPVPVVAGIVDVLHSRSDIDSPPNMGRIVRFNNIFPPIIQSAIAQQEALPTIGQIHLMIFLNPVRNKGNTSPILLAMPERAIHANPLVESGIDFGVGKRLSLSIVPPPPGIGRHIASKILLQVDAKSIFARDVPRMIRDFRSRYQPLFKLSVS